MIEPAKKDIRYGPHERNLLDFWQAKSETPAPLLLSIHGGGFRSGNKTAPKDLLQRCLSEGISVAAIAYRLSHHAPAPAQFTDCARALQFLRSMARAWNIDKRRVASTGVSAGAGISQWLAYRDDMAEPTNPDPVARESTRLTCIAVFDAQTSYDPRFIRRIIPGDAYRSEALALLFDADISELEAVTEEKKRLFEEVSPINFLSGNAPPALFFYRGRNDPQSAVASASAGIHHPIFAYTLKDRCDALGIECAVYTEVENDGAGMNERIIDFLKRHFRTDARSERA